MLRLGTLATVYRALEGRALPAEALEQLPIIAVRLVQDRIEDYRGNKAKIELTFNIDILAKADSDYPDADLAQLLWSVRAVLAMDDEWPLTGLLRSGSGIEWDPAIYDYPDPGSALIRVQQPLRLKLTEIY